MMSPKTEKNVISKKEFIRRMSYMTGFTQSNCTIAYDAFVQIMTEVLTEDRALYFYKVGWLEPYKKPARKMYRLDENGIKLDANGEKESYIFPETTWLKFRMSEGFKRMINPGVYKEWPSKK